jgi:RHS repeat-associated protein
VNSLSYDTFGVSSATAPGVADRFRYAGYQYDAATGLYYVGARWYDPSQGRWLSRDPLGLAADSNPYRYVSNTPTNAVDPSGEVPLLFIILGAGAIAAGAGIYVGWNYGGPGTVEHFIPFWGAGRALGDDLRARRWGSAAFEGLHLGLDFTLAYGITTGGIRYLSTRSAAIQAARIQLRQRLRDALQVVFRQFREACRVLARDWARLGQDPVRRDVEFRTLELYGRLIRRIRQDYAALGLRAEDVGEITNQVANPFLRDLPEEVRNIPELMDFIRRLLQQL